MCKQAITISDLPSYDIFVPQKLPVWKNFDDVISCDLWFRPPPFKNSGYANELEIAGKKFLKIFFFWRTLAPVSLVLGLGLEQFCPWPREVLSSKRLSLALASNFFGILGLGLEPCVLDSTSDGNLRDEMIRDRIVVGILDKSLAERLQLDAALTLDGYALNLWEARMLQKKQQKLLAAHANDFVIAGIQNSSKARASPINNNQVCSWCGVAQHARKFFLALKAACFNYGKIGHFKKVCRSKSVKLVTVYDEEHDNSAENSDHARFFLASVKSTYENEPDQRSISLQVNDVPMVFRIDTGADVTNACERKVQGVHRTRARA